MPATTLTQTTRDLLPCPSCRGRCIETFTSGGRMSDWYSIPCPTCNGKGQTEATDEEMAILNAMTAEFEAGLDREEAEAIRVTTDQCDAQPDAIAALAAWMGVNVSTPVTPEVVATAMPLPRHPGMDAKWFDLAVKRAFDAELCIQRTARASVVAVSSATDADVSYLVSADSCQCRGHMKHQKCLHRAFYLFFKWVNECDAVAEAAHNRSIAA